MVTCDEIKDAEETKAIRANFNEKNSICKTKKFYILLLVLLITFVLLIAASCHSYLIKYKSKQKHLLQYNITNDKLINDKLLSLIFKSLISLIDFKLLCIRCAIINGFI